MANRNNNKTTTIIGIVAFIVALGSLCLNFINLSRLTTTLPSSTTASTSTAITREQHPNMGVLPNELVSNYHLLSGTSRVQQEEQIENNERRRREEQDTNINTAPFPKKIHQTIEKATGEEVQWNTMMHRSVMSLEDCNNHNTQTTTTTTETTKSATTTLKSFEFMNTLSSYIAKDSFGQCHVSPPTTCDVTHYSVLMTFQHITGTNPLRTLFLNLLTFITYPSAMDIIVLVIPDLTTPKSTSTRKDFERDVKYGTRMLSWDRDINHKVKFMFVEENDKKESTWSPDLWTSLGQVGSLSESKLSDSIVWIDGNRKWNGNRQSVDSVGFQLWKRHSQSLIASSSWNLQIQNEPEWLQVKRHEQATRVGIPTTTTTRSDTTTTQMLNNYYLPICQDTKLVFSGGNDNTVDKQQSQLQPQVLDVSGLFFHRNMLCFLQHEVFSTLKHHVQQEQKKSQQQQQQEPLHYYHLQQMAISIVLSQVSGEIPRLYPRNVVHQRIPKPTTNKRVRIVKKENKLMSMTKQEQKQQINNSPDAATTREKKIKEKVKKKPHNNGKKQKSKTASHNSISTTTKERRGRRLLTEVLRNQQSPKKDKDNTKTEEETLMVDNDILTTMIGFFGSVVPGYIGWCVGSSSSPQSPQKEDSYHCDPMDHVVIGSIPWMNEGGLGHDICI